MKTLSVSHLRRAHTTICFSALLLSAFSGRAVAQTERTWDGTAGNTFASANNWSGNTAPGVPDDPTGTINGIKASAKTNTDIAIFDGSVSATAVTYGADRNLGGIQFSGASSNAYSITDSNPTTSSFRLYFTLGGTTSMAATVDKAVTLGRVGLSGSAGSYTISNNAASTSATLTMNNTFSSNTSGTANLILTGSNTGNNTIAKEIGTRSSSTGELEITKEGTGTWVLGGANTFTGGVTVKEGTLVVNNTTALGTLSTGGNLTVTGGTLDLFNTGTAQNTGQAILGTGANFSMTSGTWSVTLGLNTGTNFDNIKGAGAGTFSLADSTLALDLTSIAGFSFNNTYQILSGFSSGTVSNLAFTGFDSALFTANLSNTGLLSFSAIPEPSTFAVISGLGVLGICLLRRRRPVL